MYNAKPIVFIVYARGFDLISGLYLKTLYVHTLIYIWQMIRFTTNKNKSKHLFVQLIRIIIHIILSNIPKIINVFIRTQDDCSFRGLALASLCVFLAIMLMFLIYDSSNRLDGVLQARIPREMRCGPLSLCRNRTWHKMYTPQCEWICLPIPISWVGYTIYIYTFTDHILVYT